MYTVINSTPFVADATLLLDATGAERWVILVKGTFELVPLSRSGGWACRLHDEQLPLQLEPVYTGEAGVSSLRVDSDLAFHKPATDVLLLGHAMSRGMRSCSQLEVEVQVKQRVHRLLVRGDREWVQGITGLRPSAPVSFERMPLVYERAYGGSDPGGGPVRPFEARNPVGCGFASSARNAHGRPVPNLERPEAPLSAWSDRPAPIGTGPIDRSWMPRRALAGTYDKNWQRQRMPLWPSDFDAAFFQAAPAELVFGPYLSGGEAISLSGVHETGPLSFELPRISLSTITRIGDDRLEARPILDTVVVDPDALRVLLVWRCSVPVAGRKLELHSTKVFEKRPLARAEERETQGAAAHQASRRSSGGRA